MVDRKSSQTTHLDNCHFCFFLVLYRITKIHHTLHLCHINSIFTINCRISTFPKSFYNFTYCFNIIQLIFCCGFRINIYRNIYKIVIHSFLTDNFNRFRRYWFFCIPFTSRNSHRKTYTNYQKTTFQEPDYLF